MGQAAGRIPVKLGDCAAISDDGRALVVWEYCKQRQGGALVFDTVTGKPAHFFPEHIAVCDAAMDSSKRVYIADDSGVVCYDGSLDGDGRQLARWQNYLSSRGGAGVDGSWDGSTVPTSARVNYKLWKLQPEASIYSELCLDGHPSFGHGVAVSGDGAFVVTACFDNVVRVFSVQETS